MPQPLPDTACLHQTPGGLANSSIAGTLQHIMQVPQARPGTRWAGSVQRRSKCAVPMRRLSGLRAYLQRKQYSCQCGRMRPHCGTFGGRGLAERGFGDEDHASCDVRGGARRRSAASGPSPAQGTGEVPPGQAPRSRIGTPTGRACAATSGRPTCRPPISRLRPRTACGSRRAPASEKPVVPPGFEVSLFAEGLDEPRLIRAAPNGDIFVAESAAGRVRVLRPREGRQAAQARCSPRALTAPFGISFYPPGAESRMGLCRQHQFGGPLCRIAAATSTPRGQARNDRAAAADRRPLHARRGVLARRIEDVRLGRLGLQCRRGARQARSGRARGVERAASARRRLGLRNRARRRAGVRSRRQQRPHLRHRHPQLRRPRGRPQRRCVVLDQRARRHRRRRAARLHHPRAGKARSTAGRGTTSAPTKTRGTAARGPISRTRSRSRTCCCRPIRPRSASPSTTGSSSRRNIAAACSPPSTARGTAASAPAPRSSA